MVILVLSKVVQLKFFNYDQEIYTHPRSQLLLEAGFGNNEIKAEHCAFDGYPDYQGWRGAQSGDNVAESAVRQETMMPSGCA